MNIECPAGQTVASTAGQPVEVNLEAFPVTIWREGQLCCVDSAAEEILRDALQTRVYTGRQISDGTLVVERRRQALYVRASIGGETTLEFWCGLLPIVGSALQGAGVAIHRRGSFRHGKLALPTWNKRLSAWQLIRHVAEHDRGLIRYNPSSVSPIHLVAQVARAWPGLNTTVIVSRRNDAVNFARQLRAVKIDAFGFTARNQPWVEARVAVCTFAGMAYNPTEIEKQKIVIVIDAVEAVGKRARWCLEHAVDARLYGFLSTAQTFSPHEEDLVRGMYGFDELLVPWHGWQMRPVEVVWARGAGRRLKTEPECDFALKRYGLWCNDSRNRQIARLAKAFAAGDQEALAQLLLRRCSPPSWATPPRTFVIVENVEHALKLLPKLPGWSILAGGLANLDGLTAEEQAAIKTPASFRHLAAPFGIVTHTGMAHCNMPWKLADVVIRADGGTGLLDLPVIAQVQPSEDESLRPLIVVDLDDDHHLQLQRRALDRWKAYCDNGWFPAEVDPTGFRIGKFLKSRPALRQKGSKR